MTAEGQVGIHGDTFVASKYFDLKTMGSSDGKVTFEWNKHSYTWVCTVPAWTKEHITKLLSAAISANMAEVGTVVS